MCVCVYIYIPHRRVFSALTLCVFNKVVRNGTVCVCVCVCSNNCQTPQN